MGTCPVRSFVVGQLPNTENLSRGPRTLAIPFRAGRINVLLLVDQFATITPPTKPRPSKPGWRGGRITTCTSRQHRRHGSIRSSAGSLSLPERGSDAASIPQRSNWKPTSAPFIERHNEKPKPYRWTKSADEILASVKRFCHKAQQTLCSEL